MKEQLIKAFDFLAEGFFNEIVVPMAKVFILLTLLVFAVIGGMLLIAMLGVADYETMRNGLLEFSQKPWW